MPSLAASYSGILTALAKRYDQPEPATERATPFARILAVWLERAIEPRKAAAVLEALWEGGLADPVELAKADDQEVAETLRLAGTPLPSRMIRMLQRLAQWVAEAHQDCPTVLAEVATERLREELVGLRGLGAASADALLLFALGRPVYPVDRASYRILVRHGWLDPTADYEEARATLEQPAAGNPSALISLSHGLEQVGREFCRVRVARCERCPLQPFLPEGGPIRAEG
jgi:endonuclease-3 related protein